jgi:thiol-disulfide isomerase/thioredoxin
MKLVILLFISFLSPPAIWSGNFNETAKTAKTSNKLILINFSGSDWCGPCIRLKNEIFVTEVFEKFASENLLLVKADFPRQKKNKLPDAQVKLNETLAERYNKDGKFPFTLLVNSEGKILKTWDGLPKENAAQFVKQLEAISQKK